MEIYILDDLFRRETVVDRFESLIWTEKYSAYGNFQLRMHSTFANRSLIKAGQRLAINNSRRVMTVENIVATNDDNGESYFTASGRSLEAILEDRTATSGVVDGTETLEWTISDKTPGDQARYIFATMIENGYNSNNDAIPFYTSGSLYDPGTLIESQEIDSLLIEPATVYNAIRKICELSDLGFRLYRGEDTSKLYFDVFIGNDLTSSQSSMPAVIVSPDMDNLTNTTELTSIQQYKNVAYVYGKYGAKKVYIQGVTESISGFERRVLLVIADDIEEPAGTALQALLEQRGKRELALQRNISALDGELPKDNRYVYGVDYNLGDVIEMRNEDGVTNRMRITEQIFVDDAVGERSYPTLEVELFITPGSWAAWDYNVVWEDAVGEWADA